MAFFNPAMAYERPYNKSTVIIMYQHFGEDDFPQTNIGLDQFDQHIHELLNGGYHIMPVPDIIDAMQNGTDLPDKTIGITIDGSYLSIYKNAYPRLKKAGIPFTLFISPDQISQGSQSFLSWKHIKKMQKSGLMTIGNHGNAGQSVLDTSMHNLKKSLVISQRLIRDNTGITPQFFAYPYGEFSYDTSRIIGQLGFKAAFGQQSGPLYITPHLAEPAIQAHSQNNPPSPPQNTTASLAGSSTNISKNISKSFYTLPRFALNENFGGLERFKLIANALPLPVQDITPIDNLLNAQNNPPAYGFTIAKPITALKNLRCYASSGGELTLNQFGGPSADSHGQVRFEIRMEKPFSNGRTRVNCTTNGPEGRWRWFGRQFIAQ